MCTLLAVLSLSGDTPIDKTNKGSKYPVAFVPYTAAAFKNSLINNGFERTPHEWIGVEQYTNGTNQFVVFSPSQSGPGGIKADVFENGQMKE